MGQMTLCKYRPILMQIPNHVCLAKTVAAINFDAEIESYLRCLSKQYKSAENSVSYDDTVRIYQIFCIHIEESVPRTVSYGGQNFLEGSLFGYSAYSLFCNLSLSRVFTAQTA